MTHDASKAVDTDAVAPLFEERAQVPVEARWRLEDLFETVDDWEGELKDLQSHVKDMEKFRGRLSENATVLLEALRHHERIEASLGLVYLYAVARSHEDTTEPEAKARADRATALAVQCSEASSFLEPEMIALPREVVERWLSENAELAVYRLQFERLWRAREHVLPAEQEAILAAMGEVAGAPDIIFSQLTDADLVFGNIADEAGREVALTQESYGRYVQSPSRLVRRAAFEGLHGVFARFRNTLGAAYAAQVKCDRVFARLRHYTTPLEAALFETEVPAAVYRGLIAAVRRHLPELHRYVALKKRLLGLDRMEPWDLYAPVSRAPERRYTFDQAVIMVKAALAPLGDEYARALDKALSERWIDRYENRGKRSGAYSWSTWGGHPYMLLNWGGTFRDVSTLAHEAGHSMHSWFSQGSQRQAYADYVIFVAEVASTVNETLLAEHELAGTTDRDERIFLLAHQLEAIRQTIHRQTLFAEFEERAHDMDARGEALTPEVLNGLWAELNRDYYGDEVGANELLAAEWSRIPHFYNSFYVYQYATGQSAALALADRVLTMGGAAVDDYFKLLRGGCSADPITLLRRAGVDMEGDAVDRALSLFARKTDELEALTAGC